MPRRTAVIGAGPSGFAAAIAAAEVGDEVTIYEQLDRPGCKLLATGGGRCNLTNTTPTEEMARAFGRQWRFMLPALYTLPPEMLLEFFSSRGVPMILSDNFHYFPKSGRAQDLLNALLKSCQELNIKICCNAPVNAIFTKDGAISGLGIGQRNIHVERIIMACGGRGYPKLGATGSGFRLAKTLGHSVTSLVPAMVGVQTQEEWPKACSGISLQDAETRIDLPKERELCRGELLFTRTGISAFAVLDISGRIAQLLLERETVPVRINLFAERTTQSWLEEFSLWQKTEGTRRVSKLLSQYLPQRLIPYLCEDLSITAAQFSGEMRHKLAENLSALPLTITNTDGWNKAMVTRGGINLKEVNSNTLESKLIQGLHFAGEMLDLDGPCGGYNLQWAFSSGTLAGIS